MPWKNCCFELAQKESAKNAVLGRLVGYFDKKIFVGDKNIHKKKFEKKKIYNVLAWKMFYNVLAWKTESTEG